MKKIILISLSLVLLHVVLRAQNNPPIIKDFAKSVEDCNTFAFNDHLNIIQVVNDNDKFDLVAVNDQLQVLWKITLDGYGIKTDKFKNKIIALAASDHILLKGSTNAFTAYIIDPENGKVLTSKLVYQSTSKYVEYPKVYTGDGAFFKLAVRQSGVVHKLHLGAPIVSLLTSAGTHEYNQTNRLQIVEYDDKLDSVSSFKAVISNGVFISLAWNKKADMFVSWFNGPSIEVYKYDAGKTTPAGQLTVPIAFKENKGIIPSNLLFVQPSEEDRNALYYSLLYLNPDKNPILGIGKLDFQSNKTFYTNQLLDKSALKSIRKNFTPINKEFDDVDLGNPNGMAIKYMEENDGNIIVATASNTYYSSSSGVMVKENNMLLNVYDKDLKMKFQQVIPVNSMYNRSLTTGFNIAKDHLYIVSNQHKGLRSDISVFGSLNLNTGKWDKMEYLSKKHIDSSDFSDGSFVLWFADKYVVPYCSPKLLAPSKYDLTLQMNNY